MGWDGSGSQQYRYGARVQRCRIVPVVDTVGAFFLASWKAPGSFVNMFVLLQLVLSMKSFCNPLMQSDIINFIVIECTRACLTWNNDISTTRANLEETANNMDISITIAKRANNIQHKRETHSVALRR